MEWRPGDELTFDVGVIGAGTAGLAAAKAAHVEGARVVVVDHGPLGTFCARLACMPSKALLESSRALARARKMGDLGVTGVDAPSLEWPAVRAREQRLVSDFVGQVIEDTTTSKKFTLVRGSAEFTDEQTVMVDGKRLEARRWIIATGSVPVKPEIPGIDDVESHTLTSDDIFSLDALPKSIAVLGAGAIALELGQFLARAGVRVHLVGNDDHIAGLPPGPLQESLTHAVAGEVDIHLSNTVTRLHLNDAEVVVTLKQGPTLRAERLLLAVGRRPNVDKLALTRAGVRVEEGVPVRDEFFRTTTPSIFVVGDAAGPPSLLHTGSREGTVAGWSAAHEGSPKRPELAPMLRIVFCDPIVASVGLAPWDADAKGHEVVVGSRPWSAQGKAKLMNQTEGIAQIVVDKKTRKLVGCQIVGPEADLLIHLASYAIHFGATVDDLLVLHHYHPTLAEMFPSLAQKAITALEGVECTRGAVTAIAAMQ